MLSSMRQLLTRSLAAVLIALLIASCAPAPSSTSTSPAATSPSASPSATATPSPTPTPAVTVLKTTVPLPSFATVSAASGGVVWFLLGGMLLFRSTDRGDTWEQRPLPAALEIPGISFVSDREGWLSAVTSPAGQCQTQAITLWHTTDAGASWERLPSTGIADAQCKSALSFTDQTHGFLVAAEPQKAPVIYRTGDGGRSWTASAPLADPPGVTTSPGGPNLQPGRVRAFGSTLLVAVEGPGPGVIAVDYIYASKDGGASWGYAAKSPKQGSLALVTASRWLQLVPGEQGQETTDSGATWHAYATDYQQAAPIAPELAFGDASVGYATVRGALQRTVDAGAHWGAIKTPGAG